jgi:hypothetical protein
MASEAVKDAAVMMFVDWEAEHGHSPSESVSTGGQLRNMLRFGRQGLCGLRGRDGTLGLIYRNLRELQLSPSEKDRD